MQKQMKLITTAGILGLFLVANYAFELLGKIGAGIFSAVLTGQLTPESWNSELYAAIGTQSLPFLLMIVMGAGLIMWGKGKDKALTATDPEWAVSAPERKATKLAVVGGLLAFAGFYNLFVPIFFGFGDLVAGLSSPESSGYVLQAVLPNYVVLLVQMALGIWMVIGKKENGNPVVMADVPVETVVEDVDNASIQIPELQEASVVPEDADKEL